MPAQAPPGESVLLEVLVVPRASRERVGPRVGERLKVAVTAPPVNGAANRAVAEAVARALGLPRASVEVVAGQGSRRKTLRVVGAARGRVEELGG